MNYEKTEIKKEMTMRWSFLINNMGNASVNENMETYMKKALLIVTRRTIFCENKNTDNVYVFSMRIISKEKVSLYFPQT